MPKSKRKAQQPQPIIINFPLKEALQLGKQAWDYLTKPSPSQEGNNVAPALPEPKKPNIPQIARNI